VVMQYAEGKPYTKLEGLGGSFVIQGKASIVLPTAPKAGTGEVTIGKDSPGKDAKLLISWVDFFR